MIQRKYMRTRQLQPGMKLDHPVVDRLGRNLVARGAVLDEYMIASMVQMGIMSVYIQVDDGVTEEENTLPVSAAAQENIEKLRTEDRAKVTLSASVRERVATGIQFIYNNPESPEMDKATNYIADSLMDSINNNNAIAIDISALKTSDEYTFKHSVDVATISMIVAKQQGMASGQIREIGVAGLLHDIGKTKVPASILNKPGKLNHQEFEIMKQHSLFGYQMVKDRPDVSPEVSLAILEGNDRPGQYDEYGREGCEKGESSDGSGRADKEGKRKIGNSLLANFRRCAIISLTKNRGARWRAERK